MVQSINGEKTISAPDCKENFYSLIKKLILEDKLNFQVPLIS